MAHEASADQVARAFMEAGQRARERDSKNRVRTDVIEEEVEKAHRLGLRIVRPSPKNRAPFAQIISDNADYLIGRGYLTPSERAFLFSVARSLEMNTNKLVKTRAIGKYTQTKGQYLTVKEIAGIHGCSGKTASSLISSLLRKGVLVEMNPCKQNGRTLIQRPLFVNPEIMFVGDKNQIDATLCKYIMCHDRIENKEKMCLPWKVWHDEGKQWGRLYSRETYLKRKSDLKKLGRKISSNL